MNNIEFKPSIPQSKLFEYFDDEKTTEIIFGSGVGCGKSFAICALMIMKCLQYPGIRIVLARNELTTLKRTTVVSLFEVLNDWKLLPEEHYNYNSTSGEITFYNKSKIILVEMSYRPSDPQFTRFGGLLATIAVVDECSEVSLQSKQILQSRIGRWKNKEFKIKPLFIGTCNPSKGWLYNEFYKPYTENTLKEYQKFIPALITDNIYISPDYYDNLIKTLSTSDKQRLLFGNWDYDSNPNSLIDYPEIINMFIEYKPVNDKSTYYISADIAFTSDKCVIIIWEDNIMVDIMVLKPGSKPEDIINDLRVKYNIKSHNISYDSDGIAKYLMNYLPNAKPIVNNSKALNDENYINLKTQLYYKLAELINTNQIKILLTPEIIKYKDEIIEELQMIQKKITDGKIQLISKSEVKQLIGRSPDFTDAMAYKMIFNLKSNKFQTEFYSFNF